MCSLRCSVRWLLTLLASCATAALADFCEKYGWQACVSQSDCVNTKCWDLKWPGSTNPTISANCQYGNYTCAVPSIPGCMAKRCIPKPVSAFECITNEHCTTVTSEGDVCVDGVCVACGASPGWSAGGCNYTLGSEGWHKCEYSQHLHPGYECPTGGLAPNGGADYHPRASFSLGGWVAGCTVNSTHAAGNCEFGRGTFAIEDIGSNHLPSHTLPGCNASAGTCSMKIGSVPGSSDFMEDGSKENPCGWNCRDGSLKGVQCAYDQPCYMITRDQTEIVLSVPHNMLMSGRTGGSKFQLNGENRAGLLRPMRCGGDDDKGMRCAGDIHRHITSFFKTPDSLRDRDMDMLVFTATGNWGSGGGGPLEEAGWIPGVLRDPAGWGSLTELGEHRKLHSGQRVPDVVLQNPGVEFWAGSWRRVDEVDASSGVIAEQAGGKQFACKVKYSTDEPLHATWGGHTSQRDGPTRATLLVQACNIGWGHCADTWDQSNTPPHVGQGLCSVAGPHVMSPVPNRQQFDMLYRAIANNKVENKATFPGLLRLAFHDAGTYSIKSGAMKGGPNGCMRFEEVHGSAGNAGIAFFVEAPHDLVERHMEQNGLSGNVPFSCADLYQFAGVVAIAEMGGVNVSESFRWGRGDAPWLWCQGETQLAQPDFNGGHKAGWHKFGASKVGERLLETFHGTKDYFEHTLELQPSEWVALMGAHTVGRVAGLDPGGSKVVQSPFDETPETFDNRYFQQLELFSDSAMVSMSPQARPPGEAHWWNPVEDGSFSVMLDTDVSMTVENDYMYWVRKYASNETLFFCKFAKSFLVTTELGHHETSLHSVPGSVASPLACHEDEAKGCVKIPADVMKLLKSNGLKPASCHS